MVTKYWKRFPERLRGSPFLEILKSRLDTDLRNPLWVTLLRQGCWTR